MTKAGLKKHGAALLILSSTFSRTAQLAESAWSLTIEQGPKIVERVEVGYNFAEDFLHAAERGNWNHPAGAVQSSLMLASDAMEIRHRGVHHKKVANREN